MNTNNNNEISVSEKYIFNLKELVRFSFYYSK